jgi:hypothetical protein
VKFLAAALVLHVMSRAQLRELMVLFVVASALTLAVFFLALLLLPFETFTPRTWRMAILSAGIRSLLRKAEGADLSRPAEAPDPGRDHPGMVGDIISEWRAASSWNNGRLHLGISKSDKALLA